MDKSIYNTNEKAWNMDTYDAWVHRFGTPAEAAARLKNDPETRLRPILEFFGDVKHKKVINLMGSNGIKAAALAIMGAEVKVIDFSAANKCYAEELAAAAGVKIEYLLSDVLALDSAQLKEENDIVFAELGILHYFVDLNPFFKTVFMLLKKDGCFILRDFHPVSTKLISSRGSTANVRKHKVTGDYFDESIQEVEVSYSKYLSENNIKCEKKAYIRRWNLGEIVTAIASQGLVIKLLREEPNLSSDVYDKGIPKTFTVKAVKP
ncbi:MAG: class I SAM-dependent methyltransferase [Bacillota bacterium]